MSSADDPAGPQRGGHEGEPHREHDLHEYAGGYIQAHHGGIPAWLLVVYLVLLLWALYYAYVYWGSLGPGLGQ